ncbi:hypothetical protein ABEB22_12660 [Thioclava sp. 'Guangxiensis']|uniref:hypothetical protein n=1 Tax=Thioclava sp. 'Guangxiensis' TaxID=3149044 RepID=UPI003877FE4E
MIILRFMDQTPDNHPLPVELTAAFIAEVRVYADGIGQTPQNVLRKAIRATWGTWEDWCASRSYPGFERAERVLAYMRANPVSDLSQPQRKDVA